MSLFELEAEVRNDVGKGASRRLRREGRVPGIVYGGDQPPQGISVDHNELWHKLESEAFYAHVLTLKLGGATESVVLKDLQRHPSKRMVTHLDLLRVRADQELTKVVPIHFLNEDLCLGKKAGGAVSHMLTEVEIRCLPKDLPEFIAVDLTNMDVGQAVHLSELPLPAGVELAHPVTPESDQPVVSVHKAHAALESEFGEGEGPQGETPAP